MNDRNMRKNGKHLHTKKTYGLSIDTSSEEA